MRATVKCLGDKLTKNLIPFCEQDTQFKISKTVPKDLKEEIHYILLQSELDATSLTLQLILACMVSFCQSSRDQCTNDEGEGVFDIGLLVDNNTEPTQLWNENPPNYRKTPGHMPCVQVKYTEKGPKENIHYQ